MTDCCDSPDNDRVFTRATAATTARRYRRSGLVADERALLAPVLAAGVMGAQVLDVGGGVGQLGLALLDAGAARTTTLELSPNYVEEAASLASSLGVDPARVRHVVADASDADALPGEADVVLLHRVLCCTTAWREVLDAAVTSGAATIAVSIPRETVRARAAAAFDTLLHRLTGRRFTLHVHPHDEVLAHLAAHGFAVAADGGRWFWRALVFTR